MNYCTLENPPELWSSKLENSQLKQQNSALQAEISNLKDEQLRLQTEITKLTHSLQEFQKIVLEQARLIMDFVNKLKEVLWECSNFFCEDVSVSNSNQLFS